MNAIMFAAIFAIGVLMLGTIASAIHIVPDAAALKSRGHWLKDVSAKPHRERAYSKVCGDELCGSLNDASTGLRKAQIDRGFSR